jgi:hypothetical protein
MNVAKQFAHGLRIGFLQALRMEALQLEELIPTSVASNMYLGNFNLIRMDCSKFKVGNPATTDLK